MCTEFEAQRRGQFRLSRYGGVIESVLAQIRLNRKGESEIMPELDSIAPKYFFGYIAEHPLPEVTCEREDCVKANTVIAFINRTDDILNLKRAVNRLLVLGGNTAYFPFPIDRYDPNLLDMTEEEEDQGRRLAA